MTDELDWKSAALLMAADIGRITEALGMDPDDGGAAPILAELDRLRQQIAERENAHAVLTESDHTGAVSVYTGMCSDGVERQFVRRDQLAERGEPVAEVDRHYGIMRCGNGIDLPVGTKLYADAPPAQSAVPPGFRLVPEIPTREMVEAGAHRWLMANHFERAQKVYGAMLDAAPSAGEAQGDGREAWRDIASAPRDGTAFLAFSPKHGWVGTVRFDLPDDDAPEVGNPNWEFFGTTVSATHWIPLPKPSAAQAEKGGGGDA